MNTKAIRRIYQQQLWWKQLIIARSYSQPSNKNVSNSFLTNCFRGEAILDQIFPYPKVLNEDQLQTTNMMIESVEKALTEKNDAAKNDRESSYSPELMSGLKELGCFGIQVPEEYGGFGCNNTQMARFCELVGYHDLALGITLGAHQSIGFKAILLFGTPEQKQKYLPDLASGKVIAAYCLTEPNAGSDAMSIRTKAVPTADGKHYILNGEKCYISNGGFAEIFTVFAKTPCKDGKSNKTTDKITAFIVERSMGVKSGPPEKKMGIKASNTTTLTFDDVKVPAENVIGKEGKGFLVAMNVLNSGRFGLSSSMTGTIRMAVTKSVEYATQRKQFGNTLASYGAVQEKLAQMHALHYMVESMTYLLSGNMDRGFTDYVIEAAATKVFSSENAFRCVDEAIQIFGGMGFMVETGLERFLRDLRVFRIFEGATDVMRLFVVLKGIQFAGGHLKELQAALRNPPAHVGLILKHGKKMVARAVGVSKGPPLDAHVSERLRTSAALTSRCIDQFGGTVQYLLIKHGKGIIGEQCHLIRLSNCATVIYAMMAVLSRCTASINDNSPNVDHEITLVNYICNENAAKIGETLGSLKSDAKIGSFRMIKDISEAMCAQGGIVNERPIRS